MKPVAGLQLSDQQRLDWVRLSYCENVGPRTFRDLVNRFGGAGAALAVLPELSRRGGRRKPLKICTEDEAYAELDRVGRFGASIIALGEPGYPALLSRIADPPPILTIKGKAELAGRPAIAIVGARNASALGRKMAAQVARDLGDAGHSVVSGLARGIDAAAHEASLKTGTIAVVAGGIDVVYPPQNEALAAAICDLGLMVSEIAMGTQPTRVHFPRRNRLVSGMAAGTLIIDAAKRSGSLITARLALEQNREVFAVPGSPLDPRAYGGNALIRDGATLVRHAGDILEVLNPMIRNLGGHEDQEPLLMETDSASFEEPRQVARDRVADLLSVSPVDIDELIRASGAPARDVVGILLELELAGRLVRHRGQRVALAP